MNKKIWLINMIYLCLVLNGCSGSEKPEVNEQDVYMEIMGEQENVEHGESEQEVWIQVIDENAAIENFMLEDYENEILEPEEVTYITEEYGEIQNYGGEFYYDENTQGFYYNLEMFYLGSDFLYTMNDTLQEFYDDYLWQYQEAEEWYLEQEPEAVPGGKVPYSELLFLGIQHIDNDYVSLLFNDVTYMGGAHPYSMFDAITLDRHTGEEVTASEILGESNEEILETISDLMGLDVVATWEDVDFYLQEDVIVFFYRMPGYWEEVVLGR